MSGFDEPHAAQPSKNCRKKPAAKRKNEARAQARSKPQKRKQPRRGERKLPACMISTHTTILSPTQNPMTAATTLAETLFPKIKFRFDRRSSDLICKQGFYKNSFVLKLQKPCWTNDSMNRVENQTGIFFSIWINEKTVRRNRAYYNIHALKLRHLRDTPSPAAISLRTSGERSRPTRNAGPT